MRRISVSSLVLSMLICGGGMSLKAEVHSVSITATTDCTTCHQDKAQGKNVHPAVQMGCTTCHRVLDHKGVSYVEMEGGGPPTLCFECHADKKAGSHLAAHPLTFNFPPLPGTLEPRFLACTACHNPHVSQFTHLLIKGESGSKGQNLCLDCHATGTNIPTAGSRHVALDLGCDTCHVLHKQGNPVADEFLFHLTKSAPNLCTDCHQASAAKLQSAHHNLPFATANCTNCHDPHSSSAPGLAQKNIHPPYGAGKCETCHTGSSGNTLTFASGGGSALCAGCHHKTLQQINANLVQHAALTFPDSCTRCHNPHASRDAALITPDPVRACESCHQVQERLQMTAEVVHAPVFDISKGCPVCHTSHGGEQANLLRQPSGQSCLICHTDKAVTRSASKNLPVLGGKIALSRSYLQQIEKVSLHQGHTEGLPDPRDMKRTITCVTCHVPHGGGDGLMITGTTGTEKLCLQCHSLKDL